MPMYLNMINTTHFDPHYTHLRRPVASKDTFGLVIDAAGNVELVARYLQMMTPMLRFAPETLATGFSLTRNSHIIKSKLKPKWCQVIWNSNFSPKVGGSNDSFILHMFFFQIRSSRCALNGVTCCPGSRRAKFVGILQHLATRADARSSAACFEDQKFEHFFCPLW